MKIGTPKRADESDIQMSMEGDGKATVNLIPMETVIVVLDLEHSIGN